LTSLIHTVPLSAAQQQQQQQQYKTLERK